MHDLKNSDLKRKLLQKIFMLIFLLIIIFNANSQNKNKMDLKKYSYLIFANTGKFKYSATGFFIRTDGKLFLVGAGHTFNGKNTITGVNDNDYPDIISVVVCKECSNDSGIITIDISKIKKDSVQNSFIMEPEVYVYEITESLPYEVNSIEWFSENFENLNKNSLDKVIMYGYPDLVGDSIKEYKQIVPTLSYGNLVENYTVFNYYPEIETYDKINYLMKPNKNSPMGGGFSGSPCFFEINESFYFAGICIGGSITKRLIINVRPEKIIKIIKKNSNQ